MSKGVNITVSLDEFEFDEIRDFAREELDMISVNDVKLENFYANWEIVDFLEDKGYEVNENFSYPNNSIVTRDTFSRLLRNIDKVPLQELEDLLDKHNCI